jgi:hypothetical protein
MRGDFYWYWWNCWPSLNELRWELMFADITLTHSVMVNNSTNINKTHFSHQLIEWCQQFHQYQQKSPLILSHWMMVNNSTNINKNHLSPWSERWFLLILVELLTITQWVEVKCDFGWYWWNCWPSLNEFRWEVIFVDIGGIVDYHLMSWNERWFFLILVELLTLLNELMWEVSFVPQLIEWWSTIPPISTKITSHLNSFSDGQQFHQYQQKSPLTSTHWVMVNNSTNINPMSWGERWFLLIWVELLTITQWI